MLAMTSMQRRTITELFAAADEHAERATVEQLLDGHVIDAIVPLNAHLAEFGGESTPEPGPEWDGYAAVVFDDGRAMLVVDPWGDVDGDIPGR
jgi:hypothetical protein